MKLSIEKFEEPPYAQFKLKLATLRMLNFDPFCVNIDSFLADQNQLASNNFTTQASNKKANKNK